MPDDCPSDMELAAWDAGRLTAAETEGIARHVRGCARCSKALESGDSDSSSISWTLLHATNTTPDEPELGRAIEQLLASPESLETSLLPADALPDNTVAQGIAPERIGSYALRRIIGHGATGWVYQAEHVNLRRTVALKVLAPALVDRPESVAQFYREMEAAGKLIHPNIVQAFDAGHAGGNYFLAMELVAGCDASRLVRTCGPLSIADACEIARQIAIALKYTHAHGLVHRDIKPSNVMVTPDGKVKLLDLGLASMRADEASPEDAASIAGTTEYMAPEQWTPSAQIDGRTDLYALGCTLFKLCSGATPFYNYAASRETMASAHQEGEVPSLRSLRPEAPEGLDAIVRRLLAKKPEDRPKNAAEVARALAPWARGARLAEVVAAVAPELAGISSASPSQTWTSELSRPKVGAGKWIATVVLGLCALALAYVGVQRIYNRGELIIRVDQPDGDVYVDGKPLPSTTADGVFRLNLTPGAHQIEVRKEGFEPATETVDVTRGASVETVVQLGPLEVVLSESARWTAHEGGVRSLAVSADGKMAVTAGMKDGVKLWDIDNRELIAGLSEDPLPVHAIAFSPDGTRIATAGDDSTAHLWDARTGVELRRFLGHRGPILGVCFSHDGRRIATAATDNTVRVWDEATTECLWVGAAHSTWARCVEFSSDDKRLISGGNDTLTLIWDARNGCLRRELIGHGSVVMSVMFSLDGKWALTGGYDRRAVLWDIERQQRMRLYEEHAESVVARFLPGEKHFFTAGRDGDLRLWSTKHEMCLARFVGHEGGVVDGRYVAGRNCILSAGGDGTLRLWTLPADPKLPKIAATPAATELPPPPAPEGVPTVKPQFALQASQQPLHAIAFMPQGSDLVAGGEDTLVRRWSFNGEELARYPGNSDHILGVAASSDGSQIAAGGKDGIVRIWDSQSGELEQAIFGHKSWVTSLSFMNDGPWLTSASLDGSLHIWQVPDRIPLQEILTGDVGMRSVSFSPYPGSSYALAAGNNARVYYLEIGGGGTSFSFDPVKAHVIAAVAFSTNARLAAAVGWSGTIEIWNLITREQVLSMKGHLGPAYGVAFLPDGDHVVSVGEDCTARIWHLQSEHEVVRLTGSSGPLKSVTVSVENRSIAACGLDGRIYIWSGLDRYFEVGR